MKNSTLTKILIFALAFALLITSVVGIASSAGEVSDSAEAPEIISQNVYYGGDFALMFAVAKDSVSGSDVTLKVYGEEPVSGSVAVWSKTVSATSETKLVNGKECYVFTTAGVAAKDMDKAYYITASSNGATSDAKRYSVAEYLYQRLYKDGTAFSSEALESAQAALYRSVLQMGKNAQVVLFNYDNDPTNDKTTFVTDLKYVTVADRYGFKGLIDGKYTAGLYAPGESVNFSYGEISNYIISSCSLTTVDSDEQSSTAPLNATSFIVEDHTIVTPEKIARVNTPAPVKFESMSSVSGSLASAANGGKLSIVEYNDGKALSVTAYPDNYSGAYIYPTIKYDNADKVIFESYVDLSDTFVVKDDGSESPYSNNAIVFRFRNSSGSTLFTLTFNTAEAGMSCHDNPGQNFWGKATTDSTKKMHLRMEYTTEIVDGTEAVVVNVYVNGTLLKKGTGSKYSFPLTDANGPEDVSNIFISTEKLIQGDIVLDDLTFGHVSKPIEVDLSDATTFEGIDSIDGSNITLSSSKIASIVEHEGSNALKVDFATNRSEKITFTPTAEEDANTLVFEADITDEFSCYLIYFTVDGDYPVAKNGNLYDFRMNGTVICSENNGISWGNRLTPGKTYHLRIEMTVVGEALVVTVYVNDSKASDSSYGKVYTHVLSGMDENTISSIKNVSILDGAPSAEGSIYFDNVYCAKIKK